MKRILKILSIPFILILGYFIFNQYISNTYDGQTCVSRSLGTSKKNNLYLGKYKPLKDSVALKNKKIKAVDIWAEKRWTNGHKYFFFYDIKIESGINIIIPYMTKFDSVDFIVKPQDKLNFRNMGGNPGLGFVYTCNYNSDTLKLVIEQRKNNSWEESIVVDSIKYVKAY